jgi:hypothetical protein
VPKAPWGQRQPAKNEWTSPSKRPDVGPDSKWVQKEPERQKVWTQTAWAPVKAASTAAAASAQPSAGKPWWPAKATPAGWKHTQDSPAEKDWGKKDWGGQSNWGRQPSESAANQPQDAALAEATVEKPPPKAESTPPAPPAPPVAPAAVPAPAPAPAPAPVLPVPIMPPPPFLPNPFAPAEWVQFRPADPPGAPRPTTADLHREYLQYIQDFARGALFDVSSAFFGGHQANILCFVICIVLLLLTRKWTHTSTTHLDSRPHIHAPSFLTQAAARPHHQSTATMSPLLEASLHCVVCIVGSFCVVASHPLHQGSCDGWPEVPARSRSNCAGPGDCDCGGDCARSRGPNVP